MSDLTAAQIEEMEAALYAASIHVSRQQHQGAHEQDRADAIDWLSRHAALMALIRARRAVQTYRKGPR